MGKLILVLGANSSGKSAFAEALLAKRPGPRSYIATMVSRTEENEIRIRRHRERRAGLGFRTLEQPGPLGEAPVEPEDDVLLEDVSNLLANLMFERGWDEEAVFRDILALRDRCSLLVAVSISGLDPAPYEGETAEYIEALNRLNRRLLDEADQAYELRGGAPHLLSDRKGEAI